MSEILKKISPLNNREEMKMGWYILKKVLAFELIKITSELIAEGVVIIIHLLLGYNLFQGEKVDTQSMLLMKYYGYSIFIVVTILYCRIIEKRTIKSMGFNRKMVGYMKGIIIGGVLLSFAVGIAVMTGKIVFIGLSSSINMGIIIAFLGAFIMQSAMEEVLCRGYLMTSLAKKMGVSIAIIMSSVMFMLPHFSSLFSDGAVYGIIGILNLALISLIFSFCAILDKNMWIASGLHSFWNFSLYNILGLNLSGTEQANSIFIFFTETNSIINGGNYGIEASIITTLVLLIFVFLLIIKMMRKNIKTIIF